MRKIRIGALAAAAVAVGACGDSVTVVQDSNEPAPGNLGPAVPPEPKTASSATASRPGEPAAHPCRVDNGRPVPANRLRAIGTEPFWGARIDGRCVTYSTPEDQTGTRIWTRFSGTAERGVWSGALDSQRFELRTSPDPRCSDGMSDTVYPIAVTLLVRGEERRGCAEPQDRERAGGKRQ